MGKVQFFVGEQAGAGKVGGADDGGNGIEAGEAVDIEQVALGMQEALRVEAHLDVGAAQESNQVFDEAQRLFVEIFASQIADQPLDGLRADLTQTEIGPGLWFVTQQQAKTSQVIETLTQELPAANIEIGGGNVERVAFMVGEKRVEDVGHFMLLVVDDEWDVHGWCPVVY